MDRTSQAEETVRRYSDMVYRLAFARTGNTADAEDVYQEVFLRYLRSDPQFTSEEHRKAWLLRVTINCAKKLHAAPWRRRTEPLSETLEAPSPEGEALWEDISVKLSPFFSCTNLVLICSEKFFKIVSSSESGRPLA